MGWKDPKFYMTETRDWDDILAIHLVWCCDYISIISLDEDGVYFSNFVLPGLSRILEVLDVEALKFRNRYSIVPFSKIVR